LVSYHVNLPQQVQTWSIIQWTIFVSYDNHWSFY